MGSGCLAAHTKAGTLGTDRLRLRGAKVNGVNDAGREKKDAFLPTADLSTDISQFPQNKLHLNAERSLPAAGAVPRRRRRPQTAPGGRGPAPRPLPARRGPPLRWPDAPRPLCRRPGPGRGEAPPPPPPGKEPSSSPRKAPPGRGSPFLPFFLPPPARPRRGQRSLCYPAKRFPPPRGAARPPPSPAGSPR